MSVHLESPYQDAGGLWLRGNLHVHTTLGDGALSPQETVRRYAELGYDFLMISEHDVLADLSGLDPCGIVLIPGVEVSGGAHVLDVGARTLIPAGAGKNQQELLDAVNARSGFPVLCHPDWEEDFNHYPYEMMLSLTGYVGVEIFNGFCMSAAGSHLSVVKWERLLSAGRKCWGFANDDAHKPEDFGLGWNVVRARERTLEAVLEALRNGRFYASSGVTIDEIAASGATLSVRAPNADRIALYGVLGRRLYVCDGPQLQFDASSVSSPYLRVECYGRGGDAAWSQPIHVRGGKHDELQSRLAEMGRRRKSVLHACRAERAPVVTGRLDDPLWEKAETFENFITIQDGEPAPVKTRVRCILAERTLFVGLVCEEPLLENLRIPPPGGGVWNSDSVEIFIDVEGTGESCYHMLINAAGDTFTSCRGPRKADNPKVEGKAGRYDDGTSRGWSAEFVLPLDQLKVPFEPGTRWGFHLCRNRTPVRGTYVWSWVGSTNHNRSQYGSLIL